MKFERFFDREILELLNIKNFVPSRDFNAQDKTYLKIHYAYAYDIKRKEILKCLFKIPNKRQFFRIFLNVLFYLFFFIVAF